jgi:hypothetical protein
MQSMVFDRLNECFYLCSERILLKMEISNENRDAWHYYLHKKMYAEAYGICKQYALPNTNFVGSLYANELFE